MPTLPIEIVREIFQYLPIPTDELLGKGDGGAENWEKLKNLELHINHGASYNDPFDQYESIDHHKMIQISHMSLESLLDSYSRPPFFPDGLELRIDVMNLKKLLGQGSIVQRFRLILDAVSVQEGLQLVRDSKIPINLGYVSSDSPELWEILKTMDIDSLELGQVSNTSELNDYPSKRLKLYQYDPSWSIDGVLKANLERLSWNIYCKDAWKYPLQIDLDFPNLKQLQLYIFCPYEDSSIEVTLPKGLEELKILGQVNKCIVNLPQSLKVLLTFIKLDGSVDSTEGSTQTTESSVPFTSFAQLSNLKTLSFNSATFSKITDLPRSLESLEVIWEVELDVDFTKLHNLKKISIHGMDAVKMFAAYEGEPDGSNSFSFTSFSKTYCIPFHPSLQTFHTMDTKDILVISYPKLKCLELLNCGEGLFKNLPEDLKGLMVYASKIPEGNKIVLPSNLAVFQLMFDDINKYVYDNIKHLYLSDYPFGDFAPPRSLCTLEFTGSESQTPPVLDLSETRISRFSFEVREILGIRNKIIFPPTLRLLELPDEVEKGYDLDFSQVNKEFLRRV